MPVAASDIVYYGSATMAEDDVTTQIGGAIDLTTVITFTKLDADGTVEVVSDNAGDTMNLTVTGRKPDGTITSEVKALSGTTVVDFTTTFKRLLKAELSGVATGTVTLRKDGAAGDLMIFAPGVTTIRRPFYNVAADEAGGAARTFYEKIFVKNNNGTDALIGAAVSFPVNVGSRVAWAVEGSLNGTDDNGVGNDRQTAPGGYTFNTTTKNVFGDNLTPLAAQGIWMELSLAAGLAAGDDANTIRTAGTTA